MPVHDKPAVPAQVLSAFGIAPIDGVALPGGEGMSRRYGEVVLKPTADPVETEWACEVLASVAERGFRLSRPVRACGGRWAVNGWTATRYVVGEATPTGRWQQVLAAGRALHRQLVTIVRPEFLAARSHRWAHADRVAWGEQRADPLPEIKATLDALIRMRRPVSARSQLIHGDLSGNVLFAEGLAPAIIDFSPYWRPVDYADAIVAVDAVLWFGAQPTLLATASDVEGFAQYLIRAAIFRLVALNEHAREADGTGLNELANYHGLIADLDRLA